MTDATFDDDLNLQNMADTYLDIMVYMKTLREKQNKARKKSAELKTKITNLLSVRKDKFVKTTNKKTITLQTKQKKVSRTQKDWFGIIRDLVPDQEQFNEVQKTLKSQATYKDVSDLVVKSDEEDAEASANP